MNVIVVMFAKNNFIDGINFFLEGGGGSCTHVVDMGSREMLFMVFYVRKSLLLVCLVALLGSFPLRC